MHDRVQTLLVCQAEHQFGSGRIRDQHLLAPPGVVGVHGGGVHHRVAAIQRRAYLCLRCDVGGDQLNRTGAAQRFERLPYPVD